MAPQALPLLVYDGECGFCTTSVKWGQRWIRRMPEVAPFQRSDLTALGLSLELCRSAVQYVAHDGRIYGGNDAVSATLLGAGSGWWLLGAAMRAPGVHWFSGVVYRFVATHRHRLPGGTRSCSLE